MYKGNKGKGVISGVVTFAFVHTPFFRYLNLDAGEEYILYIRYVTVNYMNEIF